MLVEVKEHSKVLTPNKEHKNFTETNEIIPAGATLEGTFSSVRGLRRGQPFSYRVFITQDGKIIYSNNVKEMGATEVMLGADASTSPTKISFVPAETFKASRLIVAAAAGVGAYMYAKKKNKNAVKYAVVGAVAGYAAVWLFDRTRSVTINKSK